MMWLILFLIVAVAAFNIVSALVMVVTDKQSDIAILDAGYFTRQYQLDLYCPGCRHWHHRHHGRSCRGVALALNLERIVQWIEGFGVSFLDPNIYYISALPSELNWNDVGIIGASAFLITLGATLYPAWRASRTQPAEALRHE